MNPARQAALSQRPPPSTSSLPSSSNPSKKLSKYERKVQEEEELENRWLQHRAQRQSTHPSAPTAYLPPAYVPPEIRPPPTVPTPAPGARHLSEPQALSLYQLLSHPPLSLPPPSPAFLSHLAREVSAFTASVSITPDERVLKQSVLDRLLSALLPLWPDAQLAPFGSYCTGLSLPHSDVDITLRLPGSTPQSTPNDLRDVQTAITCLPFTRLPAFQLVGRARVPILRYVDEDRGVKVDMCVNQEDGVKAVDVIRSYLTAYPALRPLTLTLKLMLKRVGLSEVYTGGVNSYVLTLMAVFFLQVYEMAEGGVGGAGDEAELGKLLYSMLDFYGNRFDYVHYGIQLGQVGGEGAEGEGEGERRKCGYYGKLERGWVDVDKPWLLSVEDPNDPARDSAAGCFGMARVQRVFSLAHERLCMMGVEWEKTGRITGVSGESLELAANTEAAEAGEEDPEEARKRRKKEKKEKKRKEREEAKEQEVETKEEVVEEPTAAAEESSLSPMELRAQEDAKRMQVGPILSVLFARGLYVTQVLIDEEERKAAEKTAKKAEPMDAKALKKARKKERRRLAGRVVPDSDDEKERTTPKKLTKKEKKAKKREKKEQKEVEEVQVREESEGNAGDSLAPVAENDEEETAEMGDKAKKEKRKRVKQAAVVEVESNGSGAAETNGREVKAKKAKKESKKLDDVTDDPSHNVTPASTADSTAKKEKRKRKLGAEEEEGHGEQNGVADSNGVVVELVAEAVNQRKDKKQKRKRAQAADSTDA